MRAMLVSTREELREALALHFRPHQMEIVRYGHPFKAMDNLDELRPDVILWSVRDHPRHWKPFMPLLRQSFDRDECAMVLLDDDRLEEAEVEALNELGGNGIVREDLADPANIDKLRTLISRYKPISENRGARRYTVKASDRIGALFANPRTLRLVAGRVQDISPRGFRFLPSSVELARGIDVDTTIRPVSLRVGDTVLNLDARVVDVGDFLSFSFRGIEKAASDHLTSYLAASETRAMERSNVN